MVVNHVDTSLPEPGCRDGLFRDGGESTENAQNEQFGKPARMWQRQPRLGLTACCVGSEWMRHERLPSCRAGKTSINAFLQKSIQISELFVKRRILNQANLANSFEIQKFRQNGFGTERRRTRRSLLRCVIDVPVIDHNNSESRVTVYATSKRL
jgi:hypothetical protein